MSVHRHAWLFEPATWTAAGRFWDKGEIEREGHGASIVRHAAATWQIEGTMEIAGDPPPRFQNVYSIPVPHPRAPATSSATLGHCGPTQPVTA